MFALDEIVTRSSLHWADRCRKLSVSSSEVRTVESPVRLGPKDVEGISELCALCPFDAAISLPDVTSLSLLRRAYLLEPTARAFSGVRTLRLEGNRPTNVSWFEATNLRSVAVREGSVGNPEELRELPVKQFRVEWRALPVECFPRTVGGLVVNTWRAMSPKELAAIAQLSRLESLVVTGGTVLRDLKSLANANGLMELGVSARSLAGASELAGLRRLRLGGSSIGGLNGLAELKQLDTLELYLPGARAATLLDTLPQLDFVKRLTVDCVSIGDFADIASFAFLDRLPSLEEFVLKGVVLRDPDVTPIQRLTFLKRLELFGNFGRRVEQLRNSTRASSVIITNLSRPEESRQLAPVQMDNRWALFDDFSAWLGQNNNYEVERLVREEMAVAPDVASRLSFDSEAGMFSVSSSERQDIADVIAVMRRLAASVRSRSEA